MSPLEKGVEDHRGDSWVSVSCVHPFPEGLELSVPVFDCTGVGAVKDMPGIFRLCTHRAHICRFLTPYFEEFSDSTHTGGVLGDKAVHGRGGVPDGLVVGDPVDVIKGCGREPPLRYPIVLQRRKSHCLHNSITIHMCLLNPSDVEGPLFRREPRVGQGSVGGLELASISLRPIIHIDISTFPPVQAASVAFKVLVS